MITPDRFQLVKRIFRDVCATEPSMRIALLERECGEDTELRTEVESLLAEDERAMRFLETPALGSVNPWSSIVKSRGDWMAEPAAPDRIGKYRILSVLGEGGMGIVYRAAQDLPEREVALKVIRPGLLSRSALRRFEYEAHLLARLSHPGIAQIYELGTADHDWRNQPYIVMELVRGQPLLEFVRSSTPTPTLHQKLELLALICDAVHHAHQKGIIHRDLKPGNILVQEIAAEGAARPTAQPKILDFGVAHAVEFDRQAPTIRTTSGQLVGTLPYMSPEQVRGDSRDLDTRADVYSLGVICYEVLAGQHPLSLRDVSIAEAARVICEQPARLLSSADPALRGDVSTVIHKALDKDRTQRYGSASELAEDLRRIIASRPVLARSPSFLHRMTLFTRRHRAAVMATAAAVLFMVGGLGTWIQGRVTLNAQSAASSEARLRAATLQQHGFEIRENDDPFIAREGDLALLADHVQFVHEHLGDQPAMAAKVLNLIGLNYWRLGLYDQAAMFIRQSLDLREANLNRPHEEIAESLHNMGRVLWHLEQPVEAERYYRDALAMRIALHGEEHLDSASSMTHLAAALRKQGRLAEAAPLYRRTLDIRQRLLPPADEDIAASLNNLAMCLRDLRQHAEACEMFGQALTMVQSKVQPDDLRIAKAMQNLAVCKIDLQEYNAAAELLDQALLIKSSKLPATHPDLARAIYDKARLQFLMGDPSDAERLCRQVLEIQTASHSAGADAADTMTLLGIVLTEYGDAAEAEDWVRQGLETRMQVLPPGHELLGESLSALGASLAVQGRLDEAEPLLRDGYQLLLQRGIDDAMQRDADRRLADFEGRLSLP